MRLHKLLAVAPAGVLLTVAYAVPALAQVGTNGDTNGLPAPGILGLVAAVIVGTVLLARRGK